MGEIGEDTPVAGFVGVGQRGPRHAGAKAHVVELGADGAQAGFDIAQALAICQLSKGHRQKLFPAGELLDVAVTAIASHAAAKVTVGKKSDQLRENGLAIVHSSMFYVWRALRDSNRGKRESALRV